MTTPREPTEPTIVDIEAESNRQLHRRIAGWLGWPLSLLVVAAVTVGLVGHGPASGSGASPTATPHRSALTVVPAGPSRHVTPATTSVDNPAPARTPTAASRPQPEPTPTVARSHTPKPPAASAPAPPTQPAPSTKPASSPPVKICLPITGCL